MECFYLSNYLSLKFKFVSANVNSTIPLSSVIVLDSNIPFDSNNLDSLPSNRRSYIYKPLNNVGYSEENVKHNEKSLQDKETDLDISLDKSNEPIDLSLYNDKDFAESTNSPPTIKVLLECKEIFGIGIKKVIKINSNTEYFMIKIIESIEIVNNIPEKLITILKLCKSLNDFNKYIIIEYYDSDVDEFVLLDNNGWVEFLNQTKKRIKLLKQDVDHNILDDLLIKSNINTKFDEDISISKQSIEIMDEKSLLSNNKYIENELELDNTNISTSNLSVNNNENIELNKFIPNCDGIHWILNYEGIPPPESKVLSVNGVNITNIDKDFQLSLLKQRKRPIYLIFTNDNVDFNNNLVQLSAIASPLVINDDYHLKDNNNGKSSDTNNTIELSVNNETNLKSSDCIVSNELSKSSSVNLYDNMSINTNLQEISSSQLNGIENSVNNTDGNIIENTESISNLDSIDINDQLSITSNDQDKTNNNIKEESKHSDDTIAIKSNNSYSIPDNTKTNYTETIHKKITLTLVQTLYDSKPCSKVRQTVDNIIKDYIQCDWVAAFHDQSGLPQKTIKSLYNYVESEMVRLGLLPGTNSANNQKKNNRYLLMYDIPENLNDNQYNDICSHIETIIFNKINVYTKSIIAPLFITLSNYEINDKSNHEELTNDVTIENLNNEIIFPNIAMKMSFLRFITMNQLGLSIPDGINTRVFDNLIEKEEWRLIMKGIHRALQQDTPGLILNKIVLTMRLLTQALDTLINKPSYRYINTGQLTCTKCNQIHIAKDNTLSDYLNEEDINDLFSNNAYKNELKMLYKISNENATNIPSNSTLELSADELLPALTWVIIQTNPINIESVLWICSEFRHPNLYHGEEAYCLAQLTSSLEFIKSISITSTMKVFNNLSIDLYIKNYQLFMKLQDFFDCCRKGSSLNDINEYFPNIDIFNALNSRYIDEYIDINSLTVDQSDTALTLAIRYEHHHIINYILKLPYIDVNTIICPISGSSQYYTAMYVAVQSNQISTVLKLLKSNGYRYHIDDNGVTPLQLSINLGYKDISNVLLADPDKYTYIDAIESENVDIIRGLLLQSIDINDMICIEYLNDKSNSYFTTPLMTATGCANLTVIRSLFESENIIIEKKINIYKDVCDTAFTFCIKRSLGFASSTCHDENVPLLYKQLENDTNVQPLAFHIVILSMLIQLNANKSSLLYVNSAYLNPFQLIQSIWKKQSKGNYLSAYIELNNNQNVDNSTINSNNINETNKNPFDDELNNRKNETLELYIYQKKVRDFIDKIYNNNDNTLDDLYYLFKYNKSSDNIYELARNKDYFGVMSLLRQGVDPNQTCPTNGYTALIAAVFNQDYYMIELLLQSHIIISLSSPLPDQSPNNIYQSNNKSLKAPIFLDVNYAGRNSMRALHYAAQLGDIMIIGRLLQANSNRYLRNKKGLTPFDIAIVNNYSTDVINVLRYDPAQISICIACKHGDWNVVKALLNQGVSPNTVYHTSSPNETSSNKIYSNTSTVYETNPNAISIPSSSTAISNDIYCPLIAAVAFNQINLIKHLLNIPNISINQRNSENQTALMYAALRGNESLVIKLLQHGANRYINDSSGRIAADYALLGSKNDDTNPIYLILTHDPSKIYVHDVIRIGNYKGVVAMFKQDIDPNLARYNTYPNEVSPSSGSSKKSIENTTVGPNQLSKSKSMAAIAPKLSSSQKSQSYRLSATSPRANSNDEDIQLNSNNRDFIIGETPLIVACYYNRLEIVKLLLKAPTIHINQYDSNGWTPLHYAVLNSNENIVLQLLKASCNRKPFDKYGLTPIDIALRNNNQPIAALIEADPYIVHIHDMCEVGKRFLVVALLKQGCPPTYRDERPNKLHQTPLMAACQGNQLDIVKLLLRYQVVVEDINSQDDNGLTALMRAVKIGALDITAELLNAGCDREIKDNNGLKASDYASRHSFTVMFQFMSQTMIR